MRLEKQTTPGTDCDDCKKKPARICLYNPDIIGAFCPGCCYARILEALRLKTITIEELREVGHFLIDEMSEEELRRTYAAAATEGLIKGDLN